MKSKREKIEHWEKDEIILSQKIMPVGNKKYKHVEIVKYPKMKMSKNKLLINEKLNKKIFGDVF